MGWVRVKRSGPWYRVVDDRGRVYLRTLDYGRAVGKCREVLDRKRKHKAQLARTARGG